MPFLQLELQCLNRGKDSPELQQLESACFAAGAFSVTLTDAADDPIFEPELNTTPLWPEVRLSALFDADAEGRLILESLTAALGRELPPHAFITIPDRAWEREWLADFKPMRFGRRLWVSPHGQRVGAADATVVWLDPGLAFGTGTHATTALCLEWLDRAVLEGRTVIDYGCGSGILAIAAVKLGARHAVAVDHDPQALLATSQNAERNGVGMQVETRSACATSADLLIANILAGPLTELEPCFRGLLARGGDLVLSGILAGQADEVAGAYSAWVKMESAVLRDGWVRLHGRRD